MGEGDDILNLVGISLLILLIAGVGVIALAAVTAEERAERGPETAWRFERPNETHVVVIHDGGATVTAAEIVITVDGLQRQVGWSGRLSAGDGVAVRADEGEVVRVFWDPGEGDRQLLARWRVGTERPSMS